MIVRMSKIVVMGPLELLIETLALVQQLGIMQVDEEITIDREIDGSTTMPTLPDKEVALQNQLYEKLKKRIEELLLYLSPPSSISRDEVSPISMETLLSVLPLHWSVIKKQKEEIEEITQQVAAYENYKIFVDALEGLEDRGMQSDVECIGVQIEKQEDVDSLQQFLEMEYKGKVVFDVAHGSPKSLIGIIIVETEEADNVRSNLQERRFNCFRTPEAIIGLPYTEQHKLVAKTITEKNNRLESLRRKQEDFADTWYPVYQHTLSWVDSRRSLINLTAAVVKTRMCFFIHGWLPAADFPVLDEKLQETFKGRVVLEESELVEQDFSRIPTALHNPAYFEPFELFSRLLPMPPYASFDLTPFIGIFFPVFFGMMLGDIGYGIFLLVVSVYLVRHFEKRRNLRDAGKILFISSLYTVIFGVFYGEFLGTVGHEYFGLKPVLFDRKASIIPMLCFALAGGVVHVIIGLVLGMIVSFRQKMKKTAVFKLVNIVVILCLTTLIVSHFTQSMTQIQEPLLLTVAVAIPTLLLVGGLMAPLEMLKNIGNIISYARIMAVGMTSVLLAYVANFMAGRMGSVWAGIMVALLLHVFNLMLGVFAPTIHSLRLHYVEFLSKFMEPGGKEFKPFGGKQ